MSQGWFCDWCNKGHRYGEKSITVEYDASKLEHGIIMTRKQDFCNWECTQRFITKRQTMDNRKEGT
jgi:hypothetical protein